MALSMVDAMMDWLAVISDAREHAQGLLREWYKAFETITIRIAMSGAMTREGPITCHTDVREPIPLITELLH